ncbi:hypothetical protein ASD00_35255 [Ensifer sp. Root31]|uniref:hypothetical protein n=1 Tax=Ensifer sp. Root31 TaxID=1736512 RepID=UPI000708F9A0|nr:hypothetical protein [Ensifer sp. Root31]KQU81294.1 hypothetical protein ASD00_35255 [Ensifer sp. Root31]
MQTQPTSVAATNTSLIHHDALIEAYDSLATAYDFIKVASMACADLDTDYQSPMGRVCNAAIENLDSAKRDLMIVIGQFVPKRGVSS